MFPRSIYKAEFISRGRRTDGAGALLRLVPSWDWKLKARRASIGWSRAARAGFHGRDFDGKG